MPFTSAGNFKFTSHIYCTSKKKCAVRRAAILIFFVDFFFGKVHGSSVNMTVYSHVTLKCLMVHRWCNQGVIRDRCCFGVVFLCSP